MHPFKIIVTKSKVKGNKMKIEKEPPFNRINVCTVDRLDATVFYGVLYGPLFLGHPAVGLYTGNTESLRPQYLVSFSARSLLHCRIFTPYNNCKRVNHIE